MMTLLADALVSNEKTPGYNPPHGSHPRSLLL